MESIFPALLVLTAVSLLVYGAVQQVYRRGANQPQIQRAEDTATALSNNIDLKTVAVTGQLDMGQSLAPFQIIYDMSSNIISSSGVLNGKTPALPSGVLDHVGKYGEARLTWQPASGVRIAAVVVPYSGKISGYVLYGRSLREVEKDIDMLGQMVLLTWGLGVGILLSYSWVFKKLKSYLQCTQAI